MSSNTSIGPITNSAGAQVTQDREKAEIFNDFCHSVYTQDDGLSPAFNPHTNKIISTPVFSVDDVRRVLTESKNSFTCGPDGCPTIFLTKFPELSLPLCNVFNMSMA